MPLEGNSEGDGDGLKGKVEEVIKGILGNRVSEPKVREIRDACDKSKGARTLGRAIGQSQDSFGYPGRR